MQDHVLMTFLGRPGPNRDNRYRTARYRFPDGGSEEDSLFGLALFRRVRPDHLVVMGTPESVWDRLLLGAMASDEDLERLIELVDGTGVTQSALDELAPMVEAHLGCRTSLRIMPYARTDEEQMGLLSLLAENVEHQSRVSIDVTHSFRHLPMLAQMSALFLRAAKQVEVAGIYYGALDMTDRQTGLTPVLRLEGWLKLADYASAMATFEQVGDYSVLADILDEVATPALGDKLRMCAFHESLGDISRAQSAHDSFKNEFDPKSMGTLGQLLEGPIDRALGWSEPGSLMGRQLALARENLERGNYARAATLAWEAFLQSETRYGDGKKRTLYEECRQWWNQQVEQARQLHGVKVERWPNDVRNYEVLRHVRNSVAHEDFRSANSLPGSLRNTLREPKPLRQELQRLLNWIVLPSRLTWPGSSRS